MEYYVMIWDTLCDVQIKINISISSNIYHFLSDEAIATLS